MGISTNAMLLYGASYDELCKLENLDEMLDNGDLDYASPYYDSGRGAWVCGVELLHEFAGEVEIVEAVRAARKKFEALTKGLPGRILVSAHVT